MQRKPWRRLVQGVLLEVYRQILPDDSQKKGVGGGRSRAADMILQNSVMAIAILIGVAAGPDSASGQAAGVDAVRVSPGKYKILLENDHVRVIEYAIDPGEQDEWHTHPPKVSYVLSGGKLRITVADSSAFDVDETPASATWMNAVPLHTARNIGLTPVRIILVEPRSGQFAKAASEDDPAVVNPTSIEVLLENESVRVMEATLPPGFRETIHAHPGYVMYILDGGTVRLHMADGRTRDSEFRGGNVFFSDPIRHWAENTGTTTIRVLLVELRAIP